MIPSAYCTHRYNSTSLYMYAVSIQQDALLNTFLTDLLQNVGLQLVKLLRLQLYRFVCYPWGVL